MAATALHSVTMVFWKETAFSLKSRREALEQDGVLCDGGDTAADLLCQMYGHGMPCTCYLNSRWREDVGLG